MDHIPVYPYCFKPHLPILFISDTSLVSEQTLFYPKREFFDVEQERGETLETRSTIQNFLKGFEKKSLCMSPKSSRPSASSL